MRQLNWGKRKRRQALSLFMAIIMFLGTSVLPVMEQVNRTQQVYGYSLHELDADVLIDDIEAGNSDGLEEENGEEESVDSSLEEGENSEEDSTTEEGESVEEENAPEEGGGSESESSWENGHHTDKENNSEQDAYARLAEIEFIGLKDAQGQDVIIEFNPQIVEYYIDYTYSSAKAGMFIVPDTWDTVVEYAFKWDSSILGNKEDYNISGFLEMEDAYFLEIPVLLFEDSEAPRHTVVNRGVNEENSNDVFENKFEIILSVETPDLENTIYNFNLSQVLEETAGDESVETPEQGAKLTNIEIEGLLHNVGTSAAPVFEPLQIEFESDKHFYIDHTHFPRNNMITGSEHIFMTITPENPQDRVTVEISPMDDADSISYIYLTEAFPDTDHSAEHPFTAEHTYSYEGSDSYEVLIEIPVDNPGAQNITPGANAKGKGIIVTVTNENGISTQYMFLIGKYPQLTTLTLDDLHIDNISGDYEFRPSQKTYDLEAFEDTVYITPIHSEDTDYIFYTVEADDTREQRIERGDKIALDISELSIGESKSIELTLRHTDPFWYANQTYTVNITKASAIATIENIDIKGVYSYTFSPFVRSYLLKSAEPRVQFDLSLAENQSAVYTIDNSEAYEVSGPVIIDAPIDETSKLITFEISTTDGSMSPGTYTYELQSGSSSEEMLQIVNELIAPIADNYARTRVVHEWTMMNLNNLGIHHIRTGEDYLNNDTGLQVLLNNKWSGTSTDYSKYTLTLLAAGFTIEDLKTEERFIMSDGKSLWEKAMSTPGSFVTQWVLANPDAMEAFLSDYSRDDLIDGIQNHMDAQQDDGSIIGSHMGNIDGTAMSLAALGVFYSDIENFSEIADELNQTVEDAVQYLSQAQNKETGYYRFWGTDASESISMVITALCALGIDPETDTRFVTNDGRGLITVLQDFRTESGLFAHSINQNGHNIANGMATEQALRALVAYKGFLTNDRNAFNTYNSQYTGSGGLRTVAPTPMPAKFDNIQVSTAQNFNFSPYTREYDFDVPFSPSNVTITIDKGEAKYIGYSLNGAPMQITEGNRIVLSDLDLQTNTLVLMAYPDQNDPTLLTGRYALYIYRLEDNEIERPVYLDYVSLVVDTVQMPGYDIYIVENQLSIEVGKTTVWEVIEPTLDAYGLTYSYTGSAAGDNLYISGVGTPGNLLSEFDGGPNSGWMYTVNGEFPNVSIGSYVLEGGERIRFFYTIDYRLENTGWSQGVAGNHILGNVSVVAYPDENNIAVAELNEIQLAEILEMIESARNELDAMIAIEILLFDMASGVSLILPNEVLEALSSTGNISLNIISEFGSMQFDSISLRVIGAEAGTNKTAFSMILDEEPLLPDYIFQAVGGRTVIDLAVTALGDYPAVISSFGDGEVVIELPYVSPVGEILNQLTVYEIDEALLYTDMEDSVFIPDKNNLDLDIERMPTISQGYTGIMRFAVNQFAKFAIANNGEMGNHLAGQLFYENAESSVGAGQANALPFIDVSETHWAYDYIYYLTESVMLTEQDMFMPDGLITRSEFISILAELSGDSLTDTASTFNDVTYEDQFAAAVHWAEQNKIAFGTNEDLNLFNPNAYVSRQDMAVFIHRYTRYKGYEIFSYASNGQFTDHSEIAVYAQIPVYDLYESGIIIGRENGMFVPMASATRAEMATMIARMLQLLA